MKLAFYLLFFFFTLSSLAIIDKDNRFYVHDTKWDKLFNGVFQFEFQGKNFCTGFLLEGGIGITAAHCFTVNLPIFNKKNHTPDGLYIQFGDKVLKEEFVDKVFSKYPAAFPSEQIGDAFYDSSSRSKKFPVKELFLGDNYCVGRDVREIDRWKDFAFVKIEGLIPENIKRFKLLNEINLEDYDLLGSKTKKGWMVSTVGYPADNIKTFGQRLAHVGCRIRDVLFSEGRSHHFVDCDGAPGQSGSPVFKILKHKITKKIELGALGIFVAAHPNRERRVYEAHRKKIAQGKPYKVYYKGSGESVSYGISAPLNGSAFELLKKFREDTVAFMKGKDQELEKLSQVKDLGKKILEGLVLSDEKFVSILDSHREKFSKIHHSCVKYHYEKHTEWVHDKIQNGQIKISEEKKKAFFEFTSYLKNLFEKNYLDRIMLSNAEGDPSLLTRVVKGVFFGQEKDAVLPFADTPERNKKVSDEAWKNYFGSH